MLKIYYERSKQVIFLFMDAKIIELLMNAFKFDFKKLILRVWFVKKLDISLEQLCYKATRKKYFLHHEFILFSTS
jgi:hypothetical protein